MCRFGFGGAQGDVSFLGVGSFRAPYATWQIIPVRLQALRACSLSSGRGCDWFLVASFFLTVICASRMSGGSRSPAVAKQLPTNKSPEPSPACKPNGLVSEGTQPRTSQCKNKLTPMPPEDSEQIRRICERTGMKQKSAHGAQNNPSRRNGTNPKLKGAQSLHIISN